MTANTKSYIIISLRIRYKLMVSPENNNFKTGLIDGLPIGIGYLSVSFAFGIFATGSGLSILEALLISMFNATSAGQLAAVPIIASFGSLIELALTQLVINLRYSLMSVSLSQRLGESVRLSDRFLIAFMNTDEVFAVSSSRGTMLGRKYFFGIIIPPYIGWSLGTLLGAVAGNVLPSVVTSSLGIAIYAMFIAIVMPTARTDMRVLLVAILSIILSCLFAYVSPLSSVPSGFVIIICAVLVSAIFALFAPVKEEEEA